MENTVRRFDMTQTLTLTSKRQATFPAKLCAELNVKPGEKILLDRRELDGEPAWFLHTKPKMENEWFGILRHHAKNKPHDMDSIRKTIGQKNRVKVA